MSHFESYFSLLPTIILNPNYLLNFSYLISPSKVRFPPFTWLRTRAFLIIPLPSLILRSLVICLSIFSQCPFYIIHLLYTYLARKIEVRNENMDRQNKNHCLHQQSSNSSMHQNPLESEINTYSWALCPSNPSFAFIINVGWVQIICFSNKGQF